MMTEAGFQELLDHLKPGVKECELLAVAWQKFTELVRTLGKPLVMRMNLNQQSSGANWATHKNLLASTSPIVDCGVHYVDVMCRMTGARPCD